ncbi:glycogen synthase isoform 1 [Ascosphaera pollenicola]|nr:glycogen synthase isoform 1 [Ascosphaera pollenicola]
MNFPGASGPGDSGKIPGMGGSMAQAAGSMFPNAATSGLNEQEAAMVKMIQGAMESCPVKSIMAGGMGFALGGAFGLFMSSMSYDTPMTPQGRELANLPIREQLRRGFKDMGSRSYSSAKNFAVVGALFSGTECCIEGLRAKNDLANGVAAGCITGGILGAKAGPQAALAGCAGFAAFSAAIDAYMRQPSDDKIVHLDAATHKVTVDGEVPTRLELSIANLQNDFPQHEVICALQCSGNRRDTMRRRWKDLHGLNWMDGAVMNCQWKGPRLRDVLIKAGVAAEPTSRDEDPASMNVAFACYHELCEDDDFYGGSIDLARALAIDSDVILALQMNGEPLKPEYGFPVRVVVPGVAGARWVKWLDRITLQKQESHCFYQQHDYKVLPPEVSTWEESEPYWSKCPAFQAMPINSIIGVPAAGTKATLDEAGRVLVKGIAVPCGDQGPITRVEVTIDDGKTWNDAHFSYPEPSSKWSWVTWTAKVNIPTEKRGSKITILSRATDNGGNIQPRVSAWNIRGIGYNGYGEAIDVLIE